MEGTISSGSTVAIIYSRLQIIPCLYIIISPDCVFNVACLLWWCVAWCVGVLLSLLQHVGNTNLSICSAVSAENEAPLCTAGRWRYNQFMLSTAENVYRAHFLESHLPAVNVYFHTSVPGCVCRLQESQYSGLKLITPHPLPSLKRLLTWNWQI